MDKKIILTSFHYTKELNLAKKMTGIYTLDIPDAISFPLDDLKLIEQTEGELKEIQSKYSVEEIHLSLTDILSSSPIKDRHTYISSMSNLRKYPEMMLKRNFGLSIHSDYKNDIKFLNSENNMVLITCVLND